MAQRKQRERYTGPINIGDRLAFIMPGERWVTAGKCENISLDGHTLTMGNMACIEGPARNTTMMQVQRGSVIENKTETYRAEARERTAAKAEKEHANEAPAD